MSSKKKDIKIDDSVHQKGGNKLRKFIETLKKHEKKKEYDLMITKVKEVQNDFKLYRSNNKLTDDGSVNTPSYFEGRILNDFIDDIYNKMNSTYEKINYRQFEGINNTDTLQIIIKTFH